MYLNLWTIQVNALFMDCDMLMKADISELWALRDDRYIVQVCKHDYIPKEKQSF